MVVGDGRPPALGFCLNEKAITTGHNHFRALYTSRWLGNLLHALGPRQSRSSWHGGTSIAIAASMDGWLSSQWNSSNARVIFRTKGLECSPRLAHLGREVDGYLFCEARDADARACLWYGCIKMWAIVGPDGGDRQFSWCSSIYCDFVCVTPSDCNTYTRSVWLVMVSIGFTYSHILLHPQNGGFVYTHIMSTSDL